MSYTLSEGGLAYTIKLREEAKWSDKEPAIARQCADGIIRLLKPEIGAGYARLMYPIAGAEAFNAGEVGDPSAAGVRAVDSGFAFLFAPQRSPSFAVVFLPVRRC